MSTVAAASVGTLAFFAGGHDGGQHFNTIDIYNSTSGKWSIEYLSVACSGLAGTTVGSKVLFAGGYGPTFNRNLVFEQWIYMIIYLGPGPRHHSVVLEHYFQQQV